MEITSKLTELESDYADLAEELDQLQDQYNELLDQLKWVHAVAGILVEEQGGLVEISNDVLSTYDLRTEVRLSRPQDGDTWTIEVIGNDEV